MNIITKEDIFILMNANIGYCLNKLLNFKTNLLGFCN